jgi:hypothetical protein
VTVFGVGVVELAVFFVVLLALVGLVVWLLTRLTRR